MTFIYKFWKKARVYYTLSILGGGGGRTPATLGSPLEYIFDKVSAFVKCSGVIHFRESLFKWCRVEFCQPSHPQINHNIQEKNSPLEKVLTTLNKPLPPRKSLNPLHLKNLNPSKKILNPFGDFFNSLEETCSPSHMRNLNFLKKNVIPLPKKYLNHH